MGRVLNGIDLTLDKPIRLDRGAIPRASYDGAIGGLIRTIGDGAEIPLLNTPAVLYLPGYPGQGSGIRDYSGNGNHGTIVGATWVRLPSGLWVLDFDNVDDTVTLASQYAITGVASKVGFDCWIKMTTEGTTNRYLLESGTNYILYLGPSSALTFVQADSDLAYHRDAYYNVVFIPAGVWKYVACEYDGSDAYTGVYFHINGTRYQASGSGAWHAGWANGGSAMSIGNRPTANFPFNGRIALPTLYNTNPGAAFFYNRFAQTRHLFGV